MRVALQPFCLCCPEAQEGGMEPADATRVHGRKSWVCFSVARDV